MEKQAKPKNNILKFLPKAASAVTVRFRNPPFSPGRDNYTGKHKASAGKGFSGPIVSIILHEARRKSKREAFETQEPTSPKVPCMGQIKHKKNLKNAKRLSPPKMSKSKPASKPSSSSSGEVKENSSRLRRIFSMAKPARKSDASRNRTKLPDKAPSLGQMKRFASGRDAFASFDWVSQIAPVEADQSDYYSDEERMDNDLEEEEMITPFSAPMTVGGGVPLQPRKEVSLWKRRSRNPPMPLRLNSMVRQID